MSDPRDYVCLALDLDTEKEIFRCVDELSDYVGFFKLNAAFTLFGPRLISELLARGCKIFLDLKLHDIPNTVGLYAEAVTRLGVHIVTIHAAGGVEMMKQATTAAESTAKVVGKNRPKFVGVTLLTSIDQAIMNQELGIPGTIQGEVTRKAELAIQAGLDGIVCAASDLTYLKPNLPNGFLCVTPGLRFTAAESDDHRRTQSHTEAIAVGSNLLVVGRSILSANNRRDAARRLLSEIAEVMLT